MTFGTLGDWWAQGHFRCHRLGKSWYPGQGKPATMADEHVPLDYFDFGSDGEGAANKADAKTKATGEKKVFTLKLAYL